MTVDVEGFEELMEAGPRKSRAGGGHEGRHGLRPSCEWSSAKKAGIEVRSATSKVRSTEPRAASQST
jgi:hypothetical protein